MVQAPLAAVPASPPILEARGLSKSYGDNLVLNDIDLSFRPGEIVALLGENGAGKSTLVNILAGSFRPSHGTIHVNGVDVALTTPQDALRLGIVLIHQELSLIQSLSVAENIFLNQYFVGGLGLIRRRRLRDEARRVLERLNGARIRSDALAETLSAADQQTVEIAKALVHSPKILIMDEPTSSLTEAEAEALFRVVRSMRDSGVAIVFIGHRLEEAMELADRVVVLRDGRLVLDVPTRETTIPEIIKAMAGQEVDLSPRWNATIPDPGEPLIAVDTIRDAKRVHGVSFEVRRGEVLGFFGLVGAGRSELMECLMGDRKISSGTIRIFGKAVHFASPTEAYGAGLCYLPENRKVQGILPHRSIEENMALTASAQFSRAGVITSSALRAACQDFIERFDIRATGLDQTMMELSGGNQQKVLLSRLLLAKPHILILDEPTHGVDVRTKAQIYDAISEISREGTAVLLVSSELPELLLNAHRIVVMAKGQVTATVKNTPGLATQDILRKAFPDSAS